MTGSVTVCRQLTAPDEASVEPAISAMLCTNMFFKFADDTEGRVFVVGFLFNRFLACPVTEDGHIILGGRLLLGSENIVKLNPSKLGPAQYDHVGVDEFTIEGV